MSPRPGQCLLWAPTTPAFLHHSSVLLRLYLPELSSKNTESRYPTSQCVPRRGWGPICLCASLPVCSCVHGTCNRGPRGDGSCLCFAGYTGPHCDQGEQCHWDSLGQQVPVARAKEADWVRMGPEPQQDLCLEPSWGRGVI